MSANDTTSHLVFRPSPSRGYLWLIAAALAVLAPPLAIVLPGARAFVPRRDHGSSAAVTPLPGIYVMTVLTLAAGGGFAITLLRAIGRPVPLWLLVLPLPLSAAVNLLVKRPILLALGAAAGVNTVGPTSPLWFIVAAWLLPPLTEEGVKLVALLLPFVRRRMRD